MKINPLSISFVTSLFGMLTAAILLLTASAANAVTLNFTTGWNLVGNSVNAPLTVATDFNNAANVATVWKWIPATGKWAFYTPTQTDGGAAYATGKGYDFLATINGGEGFWVNAKLLFALTLAGTTPYSLGTSDLTAGWNLVSTGDVLSPAQLDTKLGGATGAPSFKTMWAWNATGSNW